MTDERDDILVLDAGLFPDGETILTALRQAVSAGTPTVRRIAPALMDEADWDAILSDILSMRKVIVL